MSHLRVWRSGGKVYFSGQIKPEPGGTVPFVEEGQFSWPKFAEITEQLSHACTLAKCEPFGDGD